jgi:hypothetical protein
LPEASSALKIKEEEITGEEFIKSMNLFATCEPEGVWDNKFILENVKMPNKPPINKPLTKPIRINILIGSNQIS